MDFCSLVVETAALCEVCDFETVSDDTTLSFHVLMQASEHSSKTGHKVFVRENIKKEMSMFWVDTSENDTLDLGPKEPEQ
jgi:hypothetical protein